MSTIDFLNANFEPMDTSEPQDAVLAPQGNRNGQNNNNQARRVRMKHSNNVVMKRGTYRGYLGYVTPDDVKPGFVTVKMRNGEQVVQSGPLSKADKSHVESEVPEKYALKTTSGEVFNVPKASLARIVSFKDEHGVMKY